MNIEENGETVPLITVGDNVRSSALGWTRGKVNFALFLLVLITASAITVAAINVGAVVIGINKLPQALNATKLEIDAFYTLFGSTYFNLINNASSVFNDNVRGMRDSASSADLKFSSLYAQFTLGEPDILEWANNLQTYLQTIAAQTEPPQ
jgi:hypothetical protein